MHPVIENNLRQIEALCRKHFIKYLYLFGSAARFDFNEKSDFDFAYVFDYDDFVYKPIAEWRFDPYIEFDDFKNALIRLLKRRVDLVPYNSIRNLYFKQSIDEDKIVLYVKESTHTILT